MIVGLPMYALPELDPATQAWGEGLLRHFARAGVTGLPGALTVPTALEAHWLAPDLMFTQTCGYPLTHALANKVQLLATPCYGALGCDGATYRSYVVVREDSGIETPDDLRGKRVAYNGPDSQSGYNTLRHLVAPLAENGRFFGSSLETGAHRRSLAAVRRGEADAASIDCVSLALIEQVAPEEVAGIRRLCPTAPAPNLPYITSLSTSAETLNRLRDGLRSAVGDPSLLAAREALFITDIQILPLAAYAAILAMEEEAVASGYPRLD
jgi:ABC-type phosphate/phosphonate transport system substrate-binding protein